MIIETTYIDEYIQIHSHQSKRACSKCKYQKEEEGSEVSKKEKKVFSLLFFVSFLVRKVFKNKKASQLKINLKKYALSNPITLSLWFVLYTFCFSWSSFFF